jgi:hypothetical protein
MNWLPTLVNEFLAVLSPGENDHGPDNPLLRPRASQLASSTYSLQPTPSTPNLPSTGTNTISSIDRS